MTTRHHTNGSLDAVCPHALRAETDRLDRRAFLRRSGLILAGSALVAGPPATTWAATSRAATNWAADDAAKEKPPNEGKPDADKRPAVRLGLLTDSHYADIPTAGTRHFRDSLAKVRAAVAQFNDAKCDVAVHLGDTIDAADTVAGEIGHLKSFEAEYAKFKKDRYYVLGNHCIWTLTKQEYLDNCAIKSAHGSFDVKGFHFIRLDACYRKDGVSYGRKNNGWQDCDIPKAEQEWLAADLAATDKPSIVLVHQRIDGAGNYSIRQHAEVRKVLEASGKVLAVFMGHQHINDYRAVGGIHYCVLNAVVDGAGEKNNAYAVVDVFDDRSIRVDGFLRQKDYDWKASRPKAG